MEIRHTGFYVNDIGSSIDFFSELGFTTYYLAKEDWGKDLGILRIAKMKDNIGNVIELLNNQASCVPANCHLAITVDNLESLSKDLISKGINFTVLPRLSPDGSVQVAFCKDPNGIIVELVEKRALKC